MMFRVFLFLSFIAIVFGIPRGFDFSDEGLYVLLADPNQQNIGGVFNYDLFFKLLYRISGLEFGIVELRILRLLTYIAGAFGLAVFWKHLFDTEKISLIIFLMALIGLFSGYGFLPPTLSYNSISVVAACLWLGIISKRELNSIDWLFLGLVFLILFYAKISVGLFLGLFTLIYFLWKKELSFSGLLLLCLPLIFFEGLFFFSFGENGLSRLTGEYGFLFQREDYSVFKLIKYTTVGGFWCFLAGLLFFIAARLKRANFKLYPMLLVVAIFGLFLVFYLTFITSEWSHLILLATFSAISWQMGNISKNEFSKRETFFFLILVLLPFFLHFGSNVYWLRLGIHYWVFWLFALMILLKGTSAQFKMRFNSFASFFSMILVLFGLWFTPFEGEYLWNATRAWEYKTGKKILLSEKQVEFLNAINAEIGNTEDTEIVSLFSNPGILYLLDMNLPFSPAYWKSSQASLFLQNGDSLDFILFNELEPFPFDRSIWVLKKELIQPNGENLQILWKK
ncbi:MAG: hypothetical protein P8O16_17365 [Algoriphagus sp.]|uniref:hypothetical protein n=1 Tax=Algoriphagus sp. TaxID=1872435 RepID=UPI0026243C82|nr:hypothetical protein [Algoriphagus sp.]MDG1279052.1 hypothetical protein [Algoriphagus sp.]